MPNTVILPLLESLRRTPQRRSPLSVRPPSVGSGWRENTDITPRESKRLGLLALSRAFSCTRRSAVGDYRDLLLWSSWRLVRAFGRAQGRLATGEMLENLTENEWYEPPSFLTRESGTGLTISRALAVFERAHEADKPLALMPPNRDDVLGEDPPALEWWIRAVRTTGESMNLDSTAITLLADFERAHEAWPVPEELIEFEEAFLERIAKLLLRGTRAKTTAYLREELELGRSETLGILALANNMVAQDSCNNVEANRARLVAKLDEAINQSMVEGDHRNAISGIKDLALIQGVTRKEPENLASMFTAMAKIPRGGLPMKKIKAIRTK